MTQISSDIATYRLQDDSFKKKWSKIFFYYFLVVVTNKTLYYPKFGIFLFKAPGDPSPLLRCVESKFCTKWGRGATIKVYKSPSSSTRVGWPLGITIIQ